MIVRTNTASFNKEMNNIVQYAFGFLDGVQKGKKGFFTESWSRNYTGYGSIC